MPLYFTYNRLASALVTAGIFSEEAEDYARKGLAAMDERAYMESRKQQFARSLAAFEKMTASAAGAKPESASAGTAQALSAAAASAPAETAPRRLLRRHASGSRACRTPAPNYRLGMKDGVMQASLAPPAPPRPATPPRPPVRAEDANRRGDAGESEVGARSGRQPWGRFS